MGITRRGKLIIFIIVAGSTVLTLLLIPLGYFALQGIFSVYHLDQSYLLKKISNAREHKTKEEKPESREEDVENDQAKLEKKLAEYNAVKVKAKLQTSDVLTDPNIHYDDAIRNLGNLEVNTEFFEILRMQADDRELRKDALKCREGMKKINKGIAQMFLAARAIHEARDKGDELSEYNGLKELATAKDRIEEGEQMVEESGLVGR